MIKYTDSYNSDNRFIMSINSEKLNFDEMIVNFDRQIEMHEIVLEYIYEFRYILGWKKSNAVFFQRVFY